MSSVAPDIFGTVSRVPPPEDIFGEVPARPSPANETQFDYPTADMSGEEIVRLENALTREIAIRKARLSLLDFTISMHPTLQEPDDWSKTDYEVENFHRVLVKEIEDAVVNPGRRLIVTIPPRHGKSTLVSKMLPLWTMGRNPQQDIIMATYGEEFAWDFGRNCRDLMKTPRFKSIFPGVQARVGGGSQGRLHLEQGGLSVFVGKGGSITGRGAHLLVLDDLVKDATEAESPTQREKDWKWMTRVAMTRLMSDQSSVILVMTRWHHDDVVGRLTGPDNPCYNAEEAKKWKVVDFPALARDNDILGRAEGEPLWPNRFSRDFLEAQRSLDPHGFSALYQQKPSIEDGDYFRSDWFKFYEPADRPPLQTLRLFGVSDHAVGADRNTRDKTVLLVFGVDGNDDIWLVDCFWQKVDTETAIEKMCDLMIRYPLIKWYTEKGVILKSIGPFLQRRMRERNAHVIVEGINPAANKEVRARSLQGMMARGQVHFPKLAWAHVGMQEMLNFPYGANDDFVDALAYAGLSLHALRGQRAASAAPTEKRGTWGWQRKQDAFVKRLYGNQTRTARMW